jgi:outer membrane protein OmpA-like peptidoglycan-associated protein
MPHPLARHVLLVALVCLPASAGSAEGPDDPLPAGARGIVLALSGEVRSIVGLSLATAGRVDALAAALQDLHASTTDTEIRIEMAADVLFDFDKADLKAEAVPALERVGTVLKSYPRSAITVEGHTDGKGLAAYNQRLSERRAAAVVAWLVAHDGLEQGRAAARGAGATRPIAPNSNADGSDNPEGRQKNRRVEIVVKK